MNNSSSNNNNSNNNKNSNSNTKIIIIQNIAVRRHAGGDAHGGDAARLSAPDLPDLGVPHFVEVPAGGGRLLIVVVYCVTYIYIYIERERDREREIDR